MALTCKSGGRECVGCGKCYESSVCASCLSAIRQGEEFYEGHFGVICTHCSEELEAEEDGVCEVCGEAVYQGEPVTVCGEMLLCAKCVDRCRR